MKKEREEKKTDQRNGEQAKNSLKRDPQSRRESRFKKTEVPKDKKVKKKRTDVEK